MIVSKRGTYVRNYARKSSASAPTQIGRSYIQILGSHSGTVSLLYQSMWLRIQWHERLSKQTPPRRSAFSFRILRSPGMIFLITADNRFLPVYLSLCRCNFFCFIYFASIYVFLFRCTRSPLVRNRPLERRIRRTDTRIASLNTLFDPECKQYYSDAGKR